MSKFEDSTSFLKRSMRSSSRVGARTGDAVPEPAPDDPVLCIPAPTNGWDPRPVAFWTAFGVTSLAERVWRRPENALAPLSEAGGVEGRCVLSITFCGCASWNTRFDEESKLRGV